MLAVQALYQVEVAGVSPTQAVRTARRLTAEGAGEEESGPAAAVAAGSSEEEEYASRLVHLAWSERHRVDALISGTSTRWRIARLGRIEVQVLRVATAELLCAPDIPPAVVIDEAIELARAFAGD